jgi:hypothetical protein
MLILEYRTTRNSLRMGRLWCMEWKKTVENLWLQPINGGPGRQITNFPADIFSRYQYSPDGKTLGVLRFHSDSDVVLLHVELTTQLNSYSKSPCVRYRCTMSTFPHAPA